MGPRDIEARGILAITGLPDEVQRAEDATADADSTRWHTGVGIMFIHVPGQGRVFDRPATETERLLLTGLGYTLPEELTTRIHFRNVLRHRSWPQIEGAQNV